MAHTLVNATEDAETAQALSRRISRLSLDREYEASLAAVTPKPNVRSWRGDAKPADIHYLEPVVLVPRKSDGPCIK